MTTTNGGAPLRVKAAYGRLYVSGPLADRVRMVPGAARSPRSQPGRSVYEVSLTLETLRRLRTVADLSSQELARGCEPAVMRWARAAARAETEVNKVHDRIARGALVDLPWKDLGPGEYRPPFDHQRVMASVAVEIDGCAFICDMGTGKTRSAIEALSEHYRRGAIDVGVVISPAGVLGTWERETLVWTDRLRPVVLQGRVNKRREYILALAERAKRGRLVVTNYEVLDALLDAFMKLGDSIRLGLVFDEGHRIRNPNAKVTKAAMKLATKASRRLLMTGTPIVGGVENIWSQWYTVDLGLTYGANYVQFRREFFDENPYTFSLDPLDSTVSEVKTRMMRRALRYRKEDCLDLPPKVYHRVEPEMGREQQRAYEQMRDDLIVRFQEIDEDESGATTAMIQLTLLLRLAQITSGYLPNELTGEVYRFPKVPKLDLLEEGVRDAVREGKQVIVWSRWRENYAMIRDRLDDIPHAEIVGGMTKTGRDRAEKQFADGTARWLLANPLSAGVGLNLQAASTAFYYSQGYELDARLQSEDRCHRSGSEVHDRILYVDLVIPGTIDEVVLKALEGKLEVADAVTEFRSFLEI